MSTLMNLLTGAACASLMACANAQPKDERTDLGKREYEANCASCHGMAGKGNGPVAGFLTKPATDLTQLAKRNGGVLPVTRMYDVIEGGGVPAHGSRDMPVWGLEYRMRAADYYGELPYDAEAYVRARVLMLVEYLNRLQAK